jgi:hypothetical protein
MAIPLDGDQLRALAGLQAGGPLRGEGFKEGLPGAALLGGELIHLGQQHAQLRRLQRGDGLAGAGQPGRDRQGRSGLPMGGGRGGTSGTSPSAAATDAGA